MPRKPIKFNLDFMKKDIFSRFTVKQFDDVTLTITPLLNNEPYDVSNMAGKIYVGVNNEMYKQDTNITVSSNSIVVTLDKNMLSKDGRAYAEIELTDSNGTVTSSSFIFDIDRKIGEGASIPGAIDGFVAKYEKLTEEFKNRFNELTASQQQDAEVIDARKGEVSLRKKIDKIDEQFNTITNEKLDKNGILSMANMGQDIKEAMTGGSVAVVGKDTILEVNIVNEQVTPTKTNFLEVGKNKFDGRYFNGAITTVNGDISTMKLQSDTNGIVVIIPIEPSETYTFRIHEESNRRRWGIMNSYPIISSIPLTVDTPLYHNDGDNAKYTFTNTDLGRYFVAYLSNDGVKPKLQLEKGEQETSYEEYKLSLKNSINLDEILEISETNKYDIDVLGKTTSDICKSFIINEFDGVYDENIALITYPGLNSCEYQKSANCISKIIKVKTNSTYTIKKFSDSGRFKIATKDTIPKVGDTDLKLILGDGNNSPINSNEFTFTTSDTDNYIVVYVSNSNEKPLLCVVEGESCENFIEYGTSIIKGYDKINQFENDVNYLKSTNEKFYFLDDINGIYKSIKTVEGGSTSDTVNLVNSNCDVIYNIYDDLVSKYPNYVTKTLLGSVGNDLNINQYVFSNFSIVNNSSYKLKKFKIVLLASIHGYEQGSAWCMANFFKQLCEDNTENEILNFMKNNVEFVVIPIGNPHGFNNNSRCNSNGVDLNRNFDADWSLQGVGTEYYGGDTVASETETQILQKVIDDNLDAEWVIDYHNIASGYPLFYLYSDEQVRLCNSVFRTLTKEWTNEYPALPKDRILGYCNTGVNACFAKYAIKKGMKSFVFETPWIMPVIGSYKYDKITTITGIDAFANTLVAILKSYK